MRSAACFTPVRSAASAYAASSAMIVLENIWRLGDCSSSSSAWRRHCSAPSASPCCSRRMPPQVHRVDLLHRVLIEQLGPVLGRSEAVARFDQADAVGDRGPDVLDEPELRARDLAEALVDAHPALARALDPELAGRLAGRDRVLPHRFDHRRDLDERREQRAGAIATSLMSWLRVPTAIETTT